jgi:arylsulfatase A-like enzyme
MRDKIAGSVETKMNRRDFLKTGAAATIASKLELAASAQAKTRKPNILYVFSDQHRAFSLPGEPFNQAMAPSIDAFRRQNFSMDRCVSNYPLCTPYRGILMSGRYPTQSGVVYNNVALSMKDGSLGETFQKSGYHTGYIGKWHLAGHGESPGFIPKGPGRLGFEDWQAWDSTNLHFHAWTYNQETGEKIFPQGWQPTRMTDSAVNFIQTQSKDKPWFLVVSWNPPHPPYNPPPADTAPYPLESLKLRPNVMLRPVGPDTKESAHFLTSEELLRTALQGYDGAITGIDKEFARLLKALDDSGQAEDTIVIYTSDHGEMMGSHGRMQKQVPFEESCRVPFMVRHPGVTKSASKSDALFAAVDIYPTLCGLAGIPVPEHCSGRDLSPIMRGQKMEESEMVFLMNQVATSFDDSDEGGAEPAGRPGGKAGEQGHGGTLEFVNQPSYRGVRTRTHTYAVTLNGRWLLFDNENDPYQMKNLVGDPAQKPLMERLDAAIMDWMKKTGDSFPYKENTKRISNFPS